MEIKRPVTVNFNYYDEDNEFAPDTELTFRTTTDMTIGELHSFCKKFAIALGFTSEQAEEAFGENIEDRIQKGA